MWTIALKIGLSLLKAFFEKSKELKEERQEFFKFVSYLESRKLVSATIKAGYEESMSDLDRQIAERKKNENTSA